MGSTAFVLALLALSTISYAEKLDATNELGLSLPAAGGPLSSPQARGLRPRRPFSHVRALNKDYLAPDKVRGGAELCQVVTETTEVTRFQIKNVDIASAATITSFTTVERTVERVNVVTTIIPTTLFKEIPTTQLITEYLDVTRFETRVVPTTIIETRVLPTTKFQVSTRVVKETEFVTSTLIKEVGIIQPVPTTVLRTTTVPTTRIITTTVDNNVKISVIVPSTRYITNTVTETEFTIRKLPVTEVVTITLPAEVKVETVHITTYEVETSTVRIPSIVTTTELIYTRVNDGYLPPPTAVPVTYTATETFRELVPAVTVTATQTVSQPCSAVPTPVLPRYKAPAPKAPAAEKPKYKAPAPAYVPTHHFALPDPAYMVYQAAPQEEKPKKTGFWASIEEFKNKIKAKSLW